MMAQDIVATIGTYQKNGETKYVTRKVGSLVETRHGPRIKLDASFNPAGCKRDEDGGVWLAIFDRRERDDAPQQRRQTPQQPADGGVGDDDIPW